jgi:Reverse transcriptase (RNA-dependent DNA polymerase)
VIDFLNVHKVISQRQYGFGKGSGTEPAVVDIVHDLRCAIDQKKMCAVVFIDIAKAYQSVNHQILLEKMNNYGIRGVALKLFESFLSGRTQKVKINGTVGDSLEIPLGAPQGSVLSNLSYVLLTNDFANLPLKGSIRTYIDDTAIFYYGKDATDIENQVRNDMKIILDIFRINRLSINTDKTRFMFFHSPYLKTSLPSVIPVNENVKIQRADSYKYLGLLMDPGLCFDLHIEKLKSQLTPIAAVLWKLKWFLPRHIMKSIYYAHFHSRLLYLSVIWGSACCNLINSLQVVQNRASMSIHVFIKPLQIFKLNKRQNFEAFTTSPHHNVTSDLRKKFIVNTSFPSSDLVNLSEQVAVWGEKEPRIILRIDPVEKV